MTLSERIEEAVDLAIKIDHHHIADWVLQQQEMNMRIFGTDKYGINPDDLIEFLNRPPRIAQDAVRFLGETKDKPRDCLQDACDNCHGTGQGRFGVCVHAISCPCPKHSPSC